MRILGGIFIFLNIGNHVTVFYCSKQGKEKLFGARFAPFSDVVVSERRA